MNRLRLKSRLEKHEGCVLRPYRDSVGKWTIGIGRNLSDNGISRDEALHMLDNDIADCETDLDRELPWWRQLNEVRQEVLCEMCFNLGITRLLGFVNTLAAMRNRDYVGASRHMKRSKWAGQVGARADDLAELMRTGVDS